MSLPKIPLMKSSFLYPEETKKQLADFILSSDRFSMGSHCREFEEAFAKKQECQQAIFVANGSVANLVLIQSLLNLGLLKKGDKVGFSALTWPTNIMPLIQLGLTPVAIDCEKDSLNVSPATLGARLNEIKGLFLTNVLGFADNIILIKQLASEKNIVFIEDNCESLGSKVDNTLLGNFGLAGTFSFFVGHHMSTIEGGMICTDNLALGDMLTMVRAHGWDRNLPIERQNALRDQYKIDHFYARYTFYDLAYNGRPTEINGLIGNIQLQYLEEIIAKRVDNFNRFHRAIRSNQDFLALKVDHMDIVSNFAMPVICRDRSIFDRYRSRFESAGVETRPLIAGDMTKQPFYAKYVKDIEDCPNATFLHQNGFYFGNRPDLTSQEIEILVNLLGK